jgi:predicted short-subunit dehydrogenase-like oxidoreductase (DUF2520 family)
MIPKSADRLGGMTPAVPDLRPAGTRLADTRLADTRLALAGAGRAGRAFARSWLGAGGRIDFTILRDGSAAPRELAGLPSVSARSAGSDPRTASCDILVLAVSDDAIETVAADLAGRLSCRAALHLSGALPGSALAALARRGAAVGSMHPVRPFTGALDEDWRGAFVAVEGDQAAAEAATMIALAVGARPHRLSADAKPLYHAAASLAAGGTAAVVSVAVDAWIAAGVPEDTAREVLSGLAERAVAAVGRQPFHEAFTGAVARRDIGTVRAHTDALSNHPAASELYRALAEEILRRTHGRGKEQEIRDVLARVGSPERVP